MDSKSKSKKEIISEKAKQKYINKIKVNPEIRKTLNEKSKASYHKIKQQDKDNGIIKNKRGRPKKIVDEPLGKKERGRPVTIKPSE
jgi:hypothetical protein